MQQPQGQLSAPTSGLLTPTEAIRTRWCYSRQPIRVAHVSQLLAAQGAGLADVPWVSTLEALDSLHGSGWCITLSTLPLSSTELPLIS